MTRRRPGSVGICCGAPGHPRDGDAVTPDVPSALRGLGVTSREMDVLRLVAGGLSNGDIAQRLYLSPRTVETHVSSLLARTGCRQPAGAPWLPRPANSVISTDPCAAASANTEGHLTTSVKEPWP